MSVCSDHNAATCNTVLKLVNDVLLVSWHYDVFLLLYFKTMLVADVKIEWIYQNRQVKNTERCRLASTVDTEVSLFSMIFT